jgi:hypothetical protein
MMHVTSRECLRVVDPTRQYSVRYDRVKGTQTYFGSIHQRLQLREAERTTRELGTFFPYSEENSEPSS